MRMTRWREHHELGGKFHPDHPDDLQAIVHDGGPRTSAAAPELVWVTITGIEGDVLSGRILNQPLHLASVSKGSMATFIVARGAPHPVLVTPRYLAERAQWTISPCDRCGFNELFDAPSDLIKAVFPGLPSDAEMDMFTAKCPLCGGVQGVEAMQKSDGAGKRPWWKFWK